MAFVDTNIILRWLLGDHKALSAKAGSLIGAARRGSLVIPDVIVAEIVYVLRATGRDRQQTGEALGLVARTPAFKYENEEVILEVTGLLTSTSLDFADCYLLARARRENQNLETFDSGLQKTFDRLR